MLAAHPVHPTLPTADVDALRPFYEEVLGFEPLAVRPAVVVYRAGGGTRFAISRGGSIKPAGHTQMAFAVSDIEAEVRELEGRGIRFEAYEQPRTEGGIARLPSGRAAWFKDPDGNLIGLIELDDPLPDQSGT